mgnify:CR=1 FL=1
MENVIVERVVDFLKQYPPFMDLSPQDLQRVGTKVRVHYIPKREVVFEMGDLAHPEFYVVQQGAIGLKTDRSTQAQWIDICDEGDILGLRPLFADQPYAMQAVAKEEAVLYAIPIQEFKQTLLTNPKVLDFLLESFASNTRNPRATEAKGRLVSSHDNMIEEDTPNLDFYQQAFYTENPKCLSAEASIQKAAKLMNTYKISSLIIENNGLPVGILTDKDIRRWVASGNLSLEDLVSKIMSSPVRCVPPKITLAEVQTLLLQHQIGHLCVTQDGTDESEIVGILSEHDIVTAQANNPVALLKQINRLDDVQALLRIRQSLSQLLEAYLETALPMPYIMKVSRLITQALVKRCIELCVEKVGAPPVKFAWLGIGSQGRGEQILLTDQDHALVFEDVNDADLESTRDYFLTPAQQVSDGLQELGYIYCPADMMASNPKFCLSLGEWKTQFTQWIDQPSTESIMMCNIFFDYTRVYGAENLEEALSQHIQKKLKGNERFLTYMGVEAVKNPPPLGFFRQFIVEDDGQHKDEFDIKARAIQPLVDAARLLILSKGIQEINNTQERFEKLMEIETQNEELYTACLKSFLVLSTYRSKEGFLKENTGRYIDFSTLTKSDKVKLKRAFKPIKDIQSALNTRFKLAHFL